MATAKTVTAANIDIFSYPLMRVEAERKLHYEQTLFFFRQLLEHAYS